MKALLAVVAYVGIAVTTAWAADTVAAPPAEGPKTNTVRRSQTESKIIGYLETRDRIITLYAGSTYSVKTKDGKVIAERVSLEALQSRFPEIHRLIRTGVARNGAYLVCCM